MSETTQTRDFRAGYTACFAGYYDKWYRYNRNDDGVAYDEGYTAARKAGCVVETQIIELAHFPFPV